MYEDCPLSTPIKMVQDHILGCACTRYGSVKTPYQLDLEVKDRKPTITPKVGDKVKIKSREWYEKWKDVRGEVDVSCGFVDNMRKHCGKIMEVREIRDFAFYLKGSVFLFSMEMFEEVYPKQEQKEKEATLQKYDGVYTLASRIEDITKRLTAYTLVKGMDPKSPTKLKMVGRTQAIKLKKL